MKENSLAIISDFRSLIIFSMAYRIFIPLENAYSFKLKHIIYFQPHLGDRANLLLNRIKSCSEESNFWQTCKAINILMVAERLVTFSLKKQN